MKNTIYKITRWTMSIQEIDISHNQKKKLLKSINNENIIFKDDNGDIVVNVENYLALTKNSESRPLEAIIGEGILDFNNQYIVFS